MNKVKYIALGVIITLSVLFVLLNQTAIVISFLFAEVHTKVSTAIAVAFFLGLFTGLLVMLVGRPTKKKEEDKHTEDDDVKILPEDKVHGIDLR